MMITATTTFGHRDRPPGWWTEGQLRGVLGQVAVLLDLTGPERPAGTGPDPVPPSWTARFALARGRGSVCGRLTRCENRARAHERLARLGGILLEGHRTGADEVRLDLAGDGSGGVVHRLHACQDRELFTIELEVDPSWFADRSAPPDATFVLLELYRLLRL